MVDWRSPDVIAKCQEAYIRVAAFLLGLFWWSFCNTLPDVELPLLRRRMMLSVTHIPYFLCRYSAFVMAVCLCILLSKDYSRTCIHTSAAFPLLNTVMITSSSTNLMLRPLALFRRNKCAIGVLIFLLIGHWGLALGGVSSALFAKWSGVHVPSNACAGIVPTAERILWGPVAFYTYTVSWDVIILSFTLFGFLQQLPMRSSPLWITLRRQGVGYVAVTTCLNIPTVVFSYLNLNGPMNIMFALPGGMISSIVSTAAVVSLMKMKDERSEQETSDVETSNKPDMGRGNLLTTHITVSAPNADEQSQLPT
ncbi:hypothetical protein BXZ70DRAFT_322158 [Cristinia sonorae]|uniref:Uncharacterized protein n=1 Tax=Cristinia sonorae TaxID=1940300 RepID=A0A8K0XNL9_9AGAR|nr:hypothetical protein BXZ70DRAFT_322158 [Cristinia sonorae]